MAAKPRTAKPLIQWMDDGDPRLVPVLMSGTESTAASHLHIDPRKQDTSVSFTDASDSAITPEMIVRCSRETGIHIDAWMGYVTPFDVIRFIDDIELESHEETTEEGIRRFSTITTPQGELSEVFLTPKGRPAMWEQHFIKTESDLPAWICLIESTAEAAVSNPDVARAITARLSAEGERWPAEVPLVITAGAAAFGLTSNLFIDAATAFYLLADHTSEMERMFEAHEQAEAVWVRCAAAAGADFVRGAVNGLELFSPAIWEKYFVPELRRLFHVAHQIGLRCWIHTCGRMNKLIEMGAYNATGVDVVESLSHLPLGDVTDLRSARAILGEDIVTRGGINVNLFYETSLDEIRARTRSVVEETRGYRHMMGDTNDSYPPYPWENIHAMMDELDKMGVLLRA